MTQRTQAIIAMTGGLVWAALLLWGAGNFLKLPIFTWTHTVMTAFLAPGIVLMAMIMRVAMLREADGAGQGGSLPQGSRSETTQRVLQNTLEQLVLVLCIWPAATVLLVGAGPGVIMALGLGFALTRLIYWAGYSRNSTLLRIFGFTAGFYPTVLVTIWALVKLASGYQ